MTEAKTDEKVKVSGEGADYYEGRIYTLRGKPFDAQTFAALRGARAVWYHSEDDCEEFDCFCHEYGWRLDASKGADVLRRAGFHVGTTAEYAARESERKARAETEAAARVEAAAKAKGAYKAALAEIPADYVRRHGGTVDGIASLTSAEETIMFALIVPLARKEAWTDTGAYDREMDARLYIATMGDGRKAWMETCTGIFRDDYRVTYWWPRDVGEALLREEVRQRGITREAAEAWLAKYRGCVDTELYEFAMGESARNG